MNVKKKNYRKIGNKKEIYIDVKTDKDEYVKSIICIPFCERKLCKEWKRVANL